MCDFDSVLVATWNSMCPTLRGPHKWIEEQIGYSIRRADCPYCGAFWVGADDEVIFFRMYGKDSSYCGSDIGFANRLKSVNYLRYL